MIIYKYNFGFPRVGVRFRVSLPCGTRILKIGEQNNELVMWYTVPNEESSIRYYIWAFTGNTEVPNNATYVDSIQHSSGLVYHLFEV